MASSSSSFIPTQDLHSVVASEADNNEPGSNTNFRRASQTSFEVWVPQFAGPPRPKGIDSFYGLDKFLFTKLKKQGLFCKTKVDSVTDVKLRSIFHSSSSCPSSYVEISKRTIVEDTRDVLAVGVVRRRFLSTTPTAIHVLDLEEGLKFMDIRVKNVIGTIKQLKKYIWGMESAKDVKIYTTSGLLGYIRLTVSEGVNTFEIVDCYDQMVFYITPNLAPHEGLQLLILGTERSILTAAIFEQCEGFLLDVFKPLSPNLKALLVAFTLFIIFSQKKMT